MLNHGKVFRVGKLDDDRKFVPEPIQALPLEPEMFGVYYDTREHDPMDMMFYVCGIMSQASATNWNVMLGYFDSEDREVIQTHFEAEMKRMRDETGTVR